jgi:hypothetical protein
MANQRKTRPALAAPDPDALLSGSAHASGPDGYMADLRAMAEIAERIRTGGSAVRLTRVQEWGDFTLTMEVEVRAVHD